MQVFRFLMRWKVTAALALTLVIVGGYFFFGPDQAASATLVVRSADVATEVSVAGSVAAAKSVDLGFAESGRIGHVFASVGTHVTAGTVLAEIENGDEAAAVAKGRAALDALYAGTRSEELAIDEAAVESAETSLIQTIKSAYVTADDAVRNRADVLFATPESHPRLTLFTNSRGLEATLERERELLSEKLDSWRRSLSSLTGDTVVEAAQAAQEDLKYIETFLDHANAAVTGASSGEESEATLSAYETSIATGRTNVASAAASIADDQAALDAAEKSLALAKAGPTAEDIAAALADLRSAQAALGATRVLAPFSGVVTRMDAKVGEIVSPSTSEISMQSDSIYQVEVYVPEVSIRGIARGQGATTTLDAYGASIPFSASVIGVDPAETMKNGVPTYKTTLVFKEADSRIRSGMTANVVITTGMLEDAIVIPAGTVGHDALGTFVSVVVGRAHERRAVTTGSSPALGRLEITAGLSDGDVIALAP